MTEAANDNYPPVLTRQEAASMCRLSPSGFDDWVRRGIVPTAIMGTRRWSRDAILRAVAGVGIDVEVLSPFEQWEKQHARQA